MCYLKIVMLYHEKDKGKIRAVLSLVEFKLKIGFVIMNKKLLSLMTFAAISATGINNVYAATSGTLNFTGQVDNSTCQITGLNQTISIPDFEAAFVQDKTHDERLHTAPVVFSVDNCASGITEGTVTFNYTPQNGQDKAYIDLTDSDMRGMAVGLHDGTTYIRAGNIRTFPITSASGSYTHNVVVNRITRNGPAGGSATVRPGTYNGQYSVTMTFQ